MRERSTSARVAVTVTASSGPSQRPIAFSLFYFASDEGENAADKYRLLIEGARFADANGFEAVWTPERHFHAFGGHYPNPSVASRRSSTSQNTGALRVCGGTVTDRDESREMLGIMPPPASHPPQGPCPDTSA